MQNITLQQRIPTATQRRIIIVLVLVSVLISLTRRTSILLPRKTKCDTTIYTISQPMQYKQTDSTFQIILSIQHGIVSTTMERRLHSSLSQSRILQRERTVIIKRQNSNPFVEVVFYLSIYLSIYLFSTWSRSIEFWSSILFRKGFSSVQDRICTSGKPSYNSRNRWAGRGTSRFEYLLFLYVWTRTRECEEHDSWLLILH